jgi:hypothetical protein
VFVSILGSGKRWHPLRRGVSVVVVVFRGMARQYVVCVLVWGAVSVLRKNNMFPVSGVGDHDGDSGLG